MDTIFVKQVKEGGPAHEAGLCTGNAQSALPIIGRETVRRAVCLDPTVAALPISLLNVLFAKHTA